MKKINRLKIIRRDEWLIEACRGKQVLHVGCTDYPITSDKIANNKLLHVRLGEVAREIIGVDIDQEGIETLSKLMPNKVFILHSAEELGSCEEICGQQFDVIVGADVVEHLSNVGLFLSAVRKLLKSDGRLLISVPQAFSIKRMIPMILQGYEYVHPDHIAYFSLATLSRILSRYGLEVEQAYMFQWHNPTFKNWAANTILLPLLWLSGGRLCDEIALVIK